MKSFVRWCRRYLSLLFVAFVALFVYVMFFNDYSYGRISEYNAEISRLKKQIRENRDSMDHYRELNRLLDSSPAEMERIVREHYGMQREGEDVYMVER